MKTRNSKAHSVSHESVAEFAGQPASRLAGALALLLACASVSADAAEASAQPSSQKERPAILETIAGKSIKGIALSAKAAGRAGIEEARITEQPMISTQMFGAMVMDPATAGFERRGDARAVGVRVAVSPAESARLDRTKPARILTLETRAAPSTPLMAAPVQASAEAQRSGMVMLAYAIDGAPAARAGLVPGSRVRAELTLQGGGEVKKTVPYSAIHYDAKGDAWVYVVTSPLHFMRERVDVERVAGDLAVLSKGPDAGTAVVSVGVSLLHGVEVFGK